MHPFPHRYIASATGRPAGSIAVDSPGLDEIASDSPAEFGGPGDRWSPETLLCAAVADCFILTFRAHAKAAGLAWNDLQCRVEGDLDRVERSIQFVGFTTFATLRIPPGTDADEAHALLEKSEARCLISNSLKAKGTLVAEIVRAG